MFTKDHYHNRGRFPLEELAKYYGRHVAWSADGTQIVASGDDDSQVFHRAKAAGYRSEDFVLSYVPFPDEVFWGSAELMGEEND